MSFLKSPNRNKDRSGYLPRAVVIHTAEGEFPGLNEWLMNPESEVSYHFVVTRTGEVTQYVDVEETAWHAGKVSKPTWEGLEEGVNPNLYTIGVAMEGYAADGPTSIQFCRLALLVQALCLYHAIDIDKKHIIGHNEINGEKDCPGLNFPLESAIAVCRFDV